MSSSEQTADFRALLEAAAKLQRAIPDAVLVGGTAAALHAHHRVSFDHDHVVQDLKSRYAAIADSLDNLDGWAVDDNASSVPMTILGSLDGTDAGLRNLRRSRPLEVEDYPLPSGESLRIPTEDETLRVKAYLAAQRNSVRDLMDVAALSHHVGRDHAAKVIAAMDEYYGDKPDKEPVVTKVVRVLAKCEPRDTTHLSSLTSYKGLDPGWTDWERIKHECRALAAAVATRRD